jgi:hypothetical protein
MKLQVEHEISGQFHQQFINTFAPISLRQKSLTYISSTKKVVQNEKNEKAASKILVKLTLGNFTL